MTADVALRRARRRAACGDVGAEAEVLRQRIRCGELSAARVDLAASLGHPAARLLHPDVELVDWADWFALRGFLSRVPRTTRVLAACAWAEAVLPAWQSYAPDDRRPERAIESARVAARDHQAKAGSRDLGRSARSAARASLAAQYAVPIAHTAAAFAAQAASAAALAASAVTAAASGAAAATGAGDSARSTHRAYAKRVAGKPATIGMATICMTPSCPCGAREGQRNALAELLLAPAAPAVPDA